MSALRICLAACIRGISDVAGGFVRHVASIASTPPPPPPPASDNRHYTSYLNRNPVAERDFTPDACFGFAPSDAIAVFPLRFLKKPGSAACSAIITCGNKAPSIYAHALGVLRTRGQGKDIFGHSENPHDTVLAASMVQSLDKTLGSSAHDVQSASSANSLWRPSI